MEQIKKIGDENPAKALTMLDSLEARIKGEDDYASHKYELLRIRLNDKADNMPKSDSVIRQQIEYFERKGTEAEKQEVYYYAGSVYRDLQDTPRALGYFFKSLDYALDSKECDSIMVRNTYSNLSHLYFQVQNYTDALETARQELKVSKEIEKGEIVAFMHLGASYLALDSVRPAKAAFDSAFSYAIHAKDTAMQQDAFMHLLNNYSEMNDMVKAKECKALISTNPLDEFSPSSCMAFAQYYESSGKSDSAAIYCRRVLEGESDIYNRYDAAKFLFRIYHEERNLVLASHYAGMYMQLSDSLDFGKRQELAATVNNEYKYYQDQQKAQELEDEKEEYKNRLIIVSLAALLLACTGYAYHVSRRNRYLRQVIDLSSQLTEKIDQNKAFISLLHQSELEGKAEDVVDAIKQSAKGKKHMRPADWKRLYRAVDELHPGFKDRLLKEGGTLTERQMQVCYLMRIGIPRPQIQKMVNLSRTTAWRWMNRYAWVLALGEAVANQEPAVNG